MNKKNNEFLCEIEKLFNVMDLFNVNNSADENKDLCCESLINYLTLLKEQNFNQYCWLMAGIFSSGGVLNIDGGPNIWLIFSKRYADNYKFFYIHLITLLQEKSEGLILESLEYPIFVIDESEQYFTLKILDEKLMRKVFKMLNGRIFLSSKTIGMCQLADYFKIPFIECDVDKINWTKNSFLRGFFLNNLELKNKLLLKRMIRDINLIYNQNYEYIQIYKLIERSFNIQNFEQSIFIGCNLNNIEEFINYLDFKNCPVDENKIKVKKYTIDFLSVIGATVFLCSVFIIGYFFYLLIFGN